MQVLKLAAGRTFLELSNPGFVKRRWEPIASAYRKVTCALAWPQRAALLPYVRHRKTSIAVGIAKETVSVYQALVLSTLQVRWRI